LHGVTSGKRQGKTDKGEVKSNQPVEENWGNRGFVGGSAAIFMTRYGRARGHPEGVLQGTSTRPFATWKRRRSLSDISPHRFFKIKRNQDRSEADEFSGKSRREGVPIIARTSPSSSRFIQQVRVKARLPGIKIKITDQRKNISGGFFSKGKKASKIIIEGKIVVQIQRPAGPLRICDIGPGD